MPRPGARSIFMPQQIRPDLVLRVASTRARLAVQRLHAHALHERAHAAAADLVAFPAQQSRQHPCTGKRKLWSPPFLQP